jgi:hypothetical protein
MYFWDKNNVEENWGAPHKPEITGHSYRPSFSGREANVTDSFSCYSSFSTGLKRNGAPRFLLPLDHY